MSENTFKQLLFLTRPWQVLFHIKLAKMLKEHLGEIPVKFVTFFSLAKEITEDAGYECVYMPELMAKVSGFEISDERFSEIDRQLFESQGANFNLMLQSERFLPKNGEDAAIFGRKHLVLLDRIVVEGTLSISSMFDHYFYWIAGALANSRGGAHFSFVACGLPPGRVIALKTPWKTWCVPFEGNAENLLLECQRLLHTPAEQRIEYMKKQSIPPLWKRLNQRYHELKCHEHDRASGSYFPESKILSIQTIKNRLPQKWFKHKEPAYDVVDSDDLANIKESLCYIPLHMEPEATISMYSPWLRDQFDMCRLVSQALPVGWKMLVKENPKMKGIRPPAYFLKLKSLPNVIIVSPDVSSTSLVLASRITVTLAGTALIEAAVLGKPSIALGRPPGLGMLSTGDFSSSLSLADLFQKLQEQSVGLNQDNWRDWLSGSFQASIVPTFNSEGVFTTPMEKENVAAYGNYILAALKDARIVM